MNLTARSLQDLSAWSDPIGVLSAFVGLGSPSASTRPTAPIELKKAIGAIAEEARGRLDHEQRTRVDRRLEALTPELDRLLDPARSGRGRAFFAGLSDGRLETVSVQLEVPTRAGVQPTPDLVPLLAVLDEGRPSGLLAIQRDGVHLFEWRLGELQSIEHLPFEIADEEWRQQKGPAHAQPMRGQQTATHTQRYERRVVANRERFLRNAAGRLAELVTQRGWDRLAVFGDARLGRPLLEALPARNEDVEILSDDRVIDPEATDVLQQEAAKLLHGAQRRLELDLVTRARDYAYAGGRGAIGTTPVLDALNSGRVSHLLFAVDARPMGYVAEDGMLYDGDRKGRPGVPDGHPQALLAHVVRRALATDARITPVEYEAAARLGEVGGLAALLRW